MDEDRRRSLRAWAQNGGKGIAMGLSEAVLELLDEPDLLAEAVARAEAAERNLAQEARLRIKDCEQRNEYKRLLWEEEQAHDRTAKRVGRLEEALSAAQAKQPEALEICRKHGFVFDKLGNEPGNWQHLAFTFYTLLCEIESIADAALAVE